MKVRKIYWLVPLILGAAIWAYATQSDDAGEKTDVPVESAAADSTLADTSLAASALSDSAHAASALADSAHADSVAREKDAILVETSQALSGSISSYLVFKSTVETETAVEVYPQISGMVERIAVEEGDRVEKGDTLLCIDDDRLRIAAREAEVNLAHLEKGFERVQEMYRRELISDQAYEDKQYQLDQARLRQKQARLELDHALIRAPFSGMIAERQVQVGTRVAPGTRLFALLKLDDMITRVYVPGQYLTHISKGQEVHLTSSFLEGKRFQGRVKRISPIVDPKSGTFKVTVGVNDRWEYLRPGLFVDVRIVTDTHSTAVLIPKQAIVYDGRDRFVFVVKEGMASKVELDAGYENGEFIESLSGIEPGMPIITVGQNGLRDQARVKVSEA